MAAPTSPHPLSPLTADEISAARELVLARASSPDIVRFAYLGLYEPSKEAVRAADAGEPFTEDRRVRMHLLESPEADVTEAVASVTRGAIDQ